MPSSPFDRHHAGERNPAGHNLPSGDFAHEKFDSAHGVEPQTLLVLYSTPRSGSTMVCDIIRRAGLCVPHEYFQPFQYRPMLEQRWGVAANDSTAYLDALAAHRTGPTGWLGVNLHAHHVPSWQTALLDHPLASIRPIELRIRRRDVYAQAVSYYIADESGKWSSAFGETSEVPYDSKAIHRYFGRLRRLESELDAFLRKRSSEAPTLWYEDFAANPTAILDALGISGERMEKTYITRQSSSSKVDYVERFRREQSIWGRLKRGLLRSD